MKGQYFPKEWADEVKAAPVTSDTIQEYVYTPLVKVASVLSQYARQINSPELQEALRLINDAKRQVGTAIINLSD